MAILLTSESARPPAALVDGDLLSIVERLERDPKPVALVREAGDAELAAGGGRKGKRAEYQCAACGYGIVVFGQPPSCPLCSEARWEHVEWRPFSQLPDNERELAAEAGRDRGGVKSLIQAPAAGARRRANVLTQGMAGQVGGIRWLRAAHISESSDARS
ncbi:MAG TPA: hypothetical protein VIM33_01140 [Gaiellaceae bacterium]